MDEHTLRDVPVGAMARIVAIRPTHRSYRSKLLSMGLTRGTVVRVERIAPLGDPVVISVRGFELSLRKDEAQALVLGPVSGDPDDHGFSAHPRAGRGRGGGRHGRGGRWFGRGRGRRGRRHDGDDHRAQG
ncbi:MAG: FeoA family protein, partial [Spirochaetota bacterium]